MESSLEKKRVYQKIIQSPDFYVWDNWGFIALDGRIHIYAQYCPKATCQAQEDRYWQAVIRHFCSEDEGLHWYDCATALAINPDRDAFDSYVIWSGSTLPLADGRVLMAYTGLQAPKVTQINSRRLALQSIGLAMSYDGGYTFARPAQPLISAARQYDELRRLGYYFGPKETLGMIDEPDGTFMTLRDPFLFMEDEILHIFFGAKMDAGNDGQTRIINAVGHAVITNINRLDQCTLCRPIRFSNETDFNQCELPNVFRRGAYYYLIISATYLHYIGEPDTDVDKTVRIYRSQDIESGWEPFGENGKHIILENKRDHLYGLNILYDPSQSSQLQGRAFVVGESYMPATIQLRINADQVEIEADPVEIQLE
jgi:hypothetical protein